MTVINYPLAAGTGTTRIIEAGSGPAVIFAHGLGARCDRFRTTVERVAAQGYRAITYDLPGHGFASKETDGPGDVPALAEHTLAVMDALKIDSAVLVGTSLGAHIVAYAACLAPMRVPALVLIGALGIVPIDQAVAETISRNVRATQREQFVGKLNFVFHDPAMVTEALIEEEFRMNTAPGTLAVFGRMGDYLTTRIANDYVASQLRRCIRRRRYCWYGGRRTARCRLPRRMNAVRRWAGRSLQSSLTPIMCRILSSLPRLMLLFCPFWHGPARGRRDGIRCRPGHAVCQQHAVWKSAA